MRQSNRRLPHESSALQQQPKLRLRAERVIHRVHIEEQVTRACLYLLLQPRESFLVIAEPCIQNRHAGVRDEAGPRQLR